MQGNFNTEAAQVSHLGKWVITADKLTGKNYTEESKKLRRTNAIGVIVDYSNSHDLCYGVRHVDRVVAWYDPDELVERIARSYEVDDV